jgi:DNA mismatch repair protein MutL
MMPIIILPDDVISQIAAGEVVERPASVVKELIENSLDAHARNIHVEVAGGGQKRIRISDDGDGIRAAEVSLALTRHATSKLRTAADLEHIQTLGFRGEALASIAAVSNLTLVTRHRSDDVGLQVKLEGGRFTQNKPIGAPAGTLITIENLFFNTPARLKFMKSENTEKRNISAVIMNYAMAYPGVRFVLSQDGREAFRSPGQGNLGDVVVSVFGLETFRDMIEINQREFSRENGIEVTIRGYVSQPENNRKDRTRIVLFVNGRAVQDAGLSYAVTQAYHSLIEKGRHPLAVLMLTVPTEFVDVNVHPTKAEVRFQDTNLIFAALQRAIRQSVLGYKPAVLHTRMVASDGDLWQGSLRLDRNRIELNGESHTSKARPDLRADSDEGLELIPETMERLARPRTLPLLRVIGQIGATYIIAEGPAGMYLIDQHAAHTRILYQEAQDLLAVSDNLPGRALESVTLQTSAADARILAQHIQLLSRFGFDLEEFGGTTFLIRSVPLWIGNSDPVQCLLSLPEILREKRTDPQQDILIRLADLIAIKSGQILSTDDMRDIVRRLERCPEPQRSPTGQNTLIHMSANELEREFNRRSSTDL